MISIALERHLTLRLFAEHAHTIVRIRPNTGICMAMSTRRKPGVPRDLSRLTAWGSGTELCGPTPDGVSRIGERSVPTDPEPYGRSMIISSVFGAFGSSGRMSVISSDPAAEVSGFGSLNMSLLLSIGIISCFNEYILINCIFICNCKTQK